MEASLKSLFERRFGETLDSLSALKGDGSDRKLFRLKSSGRTVIGAANTDRAENRAFLAFSRHFKASGLPVPEIYAEDLERGVYLEEDLGDTNLFQLLSQSRTEKGFPQAAIDVYRNVVRMLPRFQIEAGKTLDYSLCHPRGSFDKQSIMWDLNYFKYYFLRLGHVPFNEQALENDFQKFAAYLLKADRDFFLYRDFQSRNIMVREGKPWFIDYQGGRKGALQYDIASLLFDAKADLPFELRDELLERYIEAVGSLMPIDRERFLRFYHCYVFIRIMQAMGAYGLRGFYERKVHFLQSIPYAIRNIEFLLRTVKLHVEVPELMGVFRWLVASSAMRQYGEASLKLTVRIQSFSYRDGMPVDETGHGGGFVFDCRCLPNPGRVAGFAKLTGKDPETIAFLEKTPEVSRFLEHVYAILDQAVEDYRSRNFTDLMVAFGCTGGRHRSVYCAELLAKRLRDRFGVSVELRHRKQEEKPIEAETVA